ncbi:uncharacterized protein [Primulina huaijiensis]|uniref:uncharacterized protein n=1 Tax=Primulina huaijiensis TaxID=1492673 RepID=UPI003CC6F2E3
MLWRLMQNFLKVAPCFAEKLQALAAIHHVSSPIDYHTAEKRRTKSCAKSISNQERLQTPFLTPQIVQTTLRSCRSDLVALSFFLWCARQPNYFHDKSTFHHMVNVVSNLTSRFGTVKGIVQELETVGCVTKAQTFLLLMRIYWRGAMYDMVLEVFEVMNNYGYIPNTYVKNIVIDVLFKIERVDMALRVLNGSLAPNFLSFSIAICNLCRLNEVHNVKVVLSRMFMMGFYLNPETYLLVLNCFSKFGMLAEALQLLGMMIVLGVPVSMNVWGILIDGFCKSGRIEVAIYLLEKMFKIGCTPNIITCTSLIKGLLESRMPSKAFEILGTLELKGCFPDLVLCNVLIDCLSKIGWYNVAFKVYSDMRDLRLTPDVYTLSSLMSTICLSKQYVLLPLLISGLAVQPDLVVCNCFLFYFCKAGYPEGAVEYYNDMIYRGFQPDNYSFAGLLSALCRLGRTHEALNVYQGIIHINPGVDAHVHTIMIHGLIKSGCFSRAIGLVKKAATENFSLDVVSFNVAIEGLLGFGLAEDAYSLFSQMKQMNVAPNMKSYNLILSGFCKNRDVNMVLHVLQEMAYSNIGLDDCTFKLVKKLFHNSVSALNLFAELRTLGLLPKDAQMLSANGQANDYPRDDSGLRMPVYHDLPSAVVSLG